MQTRREFLIETMGIGAAAIFSTGVGYTPNDDRQIILVCDKPNKNRRIYPKHIVEKAVKSFCGQDILGHSEIQGDGKVHFSSISHRVTNLKFVDVEGYPTLVGNIEFLDTPKGKIAKQMFDEGYKLAFRPTGIGSIRMNEDQNFVIQDSYKMICIDMMPADVAS